MRFTSEGSLLFTAFLSAHRPLPARLGELGFRPLDKHSRMNTKASSSLRFEYLAVWFAVFALAGASAEDFVSKGVKLRYLVEGQGPPVVLIHGLTLDVESQWAAANLTRPMFKYWREA
jgi:hypothetical protein